MTITQSPRSNKFPTEITALRRQLRKNGFDVLPFSGGQPHTKINTIRDWEWEHHHDILDWAWEHPRATSTGIDAKFAPAININI